MNRLESIAKQFDEIGSIALTAVLVDQKVTQWKLNGTYHVNAQKWGDRIEFLAVVAEIVAHLSYKNRDTWFSFLLNKYPDQFQTDTGDGPFLYQEFDGDEKVGPIHVQIEKMVLDVVRLSARAARDLIEEEQNEPDGSSQIQQLRLGRSTAAAIEELPEDESSENDLGLRFQKAFESYNMAAKNLTNGATDRDVHHWLKENGLDEYDLPNFETWRRYLRTARSFYEARKNTPTVGRSGRSVVDRNKI